MFEQWVKVKYILNGKFTFNVPPNCSQKMESAGVWKLFAFKYECCTLNYHLNKRLVYFVINLEGGS